MLTGLNRLETFTIKLEVKKEGGMLICFSIYDLKLNIHAKILLDRSQSLKIDFMLNLTFQHFNLLYFLKHEVNEVYMGISLIS